MRNFPVHYLERCKIMSHYLLLPHLIDARCSNILFLHRYINSVVGINILGIISMYSKVWSHLELGEKHIMNLMRDPPQHQKSEFFVIFIHLDLMKFYFVVESCTQFSNNKVNYPQFFICFFLFRHFVISPSSRFHFLLQNAHVQSV